MAKIKITALPEATGLAPTDLLTAVSSSISTKITVQTLSNNLTEVSQSISASFAYTASFVTSSNIWGPFGSDSIVSSSYALTASYALNGGGGGSGTNGTSGTSGAAGTSGTSGTAGASGTSGTSGTSGSSGTSGTGFNTISNAADNRILTSDGNPNQAVAETNFIFDGSIAFLTGSLIVSGVNGGGIFSQGATLTDYIDGISNSGSYMVWRAPFSSSVVALYGYYIGGSSPQINAVRSGSSGYGLITASNLVLSTPNVWSPAIAGGLQNRDFNTGDSLQVIMSGSANNQIAVQVDFIRKF